ncbi:hypothetical protein EJ03DRAFT_325206 [Teratosphaeria nubilosa]|uniref:Uncharacterized protein n=1 Tax=Teratosphaeria nubilosa TaxID=161662 RepID=A0A6G1LHR6_9PEZI|nr:hypothetical protein EJ03DRAFT_325206 [Teratosphaeria nubilosa]
MIALLSLARSIHIGSLLSGPLIDGRSMHFAACLCAGKASRLGPSASADADGGDIILNCIEPHWLYLEAAGWHQQFTCND